MNKFTAAFDQRMPHIISKLLLSQREENSEREIGSLLTNCRGQTSRLATFSAMGYEQYRQNIEWSHRKLLFETPTLIRVKPPTRRYHRSYIESEEYQGGNALERWIVHLIQGLQVPNKDTNSVMRRSVQSKFYKMEVRVNEQGYCVPQGAERDTMGSFLLQVE